jgi:hypothetical protein
LNQITADAAGSREYLVEVGAAVERRGLAYNRLWRFPIKPPALLEVIG